MSLPKLNDGSKDNKSNKVSNLPAFDMPPINELNDNEGNNFEDVDVEEVLDYEDDNLNEDIYEEVNNLKDDNDLPAINYDNDNEYLANENDYNPDYEEDLENNKKRKFIDKENKKLIPFGGKRSKRLIKSSDFDDRKNKLATTKIMRFIIMSFILLLFLFGLKNTFFPSHVYTGEQIKRFAKEGAGLTDFPRERGEAFVESFMESFLTFDRTRPELNDILSYFYGESGFATVGYEKMNMRLGTEAKQHILIAPKVYDVKMLTDYSALFKVNAYVSNTDGTDTFGKDTNGRWLSFAINVYYDKDVDTLAITPDSPSIIPTSNIGRLSDVPPRAPFGNGKVNQQIGPAINPTINGFVEAYANSSIASHDSIKQYISDKNDISLYNGFGGTVKLNGPPGSAIKRTIYDGDDGIYRVDLTVKWIDTIASGDNHQVEYTAKYVMRVNPQGEGKYLVSSFVPYTFYTH